MLAAKHYLEPNLKPSRAHDRARTRKEQHAGVSRTGVGALDKDSMVAKMSYVATMASLMRPAGMVPFHRTAAGSRMPPASKQTGHDVDARARQTQDSGQVSLKRKVAAVSVLIISGPQC